LNHPNIAKLREIVLCPDHRQTSVIEEYVPHVSFEKLCCILSLNDIRLYMKQLLEVTL
jgi:serine/threonine protein kinase